MKLTDVFDKLTTLYYKPFSELKHQEELSNFTINKGNTGQFLQQLLDMPNNSNLTDFEDGELKTNKADSTGTPKETMFITQISQDFDSLFFSEHLNNRLLQKISNLLYLPVCKTSPSPNDWYFLPAYHIDARINPQLIEIYTQDYLSIKTQTITIYIPRVGNTFKFAVKMLNVLMVNIILFFPNTLIDMYPIKIMHFISKETLCLICRMVL